MSALKDAIEVTRRFGAPRQAVWAAWTNPGIAGRWLFTSPNSETHSAELDVRVGGAWTITDRREGVDYTAVGEYLAVEPPRRLAFTFGMPQFSPSFGRVIVTLEADGRGCLMALRQEDLPLEHHEPTILGWEQMFDTLGQVLEG
jgi:uncharacterized protein YndB with AHSA1/START domain